MIRFRLSHLLIFGLIAGFSLLQAGCAASAGGKFYGKTEPPQDNVLRYITGSEPRSLDPPIGTGQPEARIYIALFDGLVDYHPKTMEPIPAIAESWEVSQDGTEYIFYLRKNAKFSNGDPIKAKDFVYSFRRALSPELASESSTLAYFIKYSEAYNSSSVFLKKADGAFYLKHEFEDGEGGKEEEKPSTLGPDTEFHKFINSPERMKLKGDPFDRAKEIEASDKLKDVFKYSAADIKDAQAFAKKISAGGDGLSKFLAKNLDAAALASCARQDCGDSEKQLLADGLNKLLPGEFIYSAERFEGAAMPENSAKFYEKITKENKKRSDDNAAIDAEVAKLTDEVKKQEKLKGKKNPMEKLFYFNKFLLEESYPNELGKIELIKAKAEDIGVEAIDDYTFRVKLYQPAPYFLGVLAHQLFKVVHQGTIEKYGKEWVKPKNIVTSGPFLLSDHRPYEVLIAKKDPNYWDKDNVKLDGIEFYPLEETTTMMNLYKSGYVDSLYNHTVPAAWLEQVKPVSKDEYLNFPEVASEFYVINVKKPPMDNLKVRQAFSLAVDRPALSRFRKTTKPLADFAPEGIFPKYDEARKKVAARKVKELGIDEKVWEKRLFDPERARKLLAEAGYPVEGAEGSYSCPKFPVDKVNITYNTAESNKAVAEFVQAQWKQNLGITVPLKNLEFKTYLPMLNKVEYEGFGRRGWVGDYMDPFTFLDLFYTEANNGATGWTDKAYDKMLTEANRTLDPEKRFEIMAEAEFYMLQQQLVIPLQTQATNWMKKPYVKGLYPNPGTLHSWKFVYIERDPAKWDKDVENLMEEKDPSVERQLEDLMAAQKAREEKAKEAMKGAKVE